jgi:formate dehydrogenase alpha subunit
VNNKELAINMATTAKTITLNINGVDYEGKQGQTILEIAGEHGIDIPTMCYDKRLEPFGACRTCLVEVTGARNPLPACTTPAADKMVIQTQTAKVEKLRHSVIELLLTTHPLDCPVCDKAGECDLQDMAYEFGVSENRFKAPIPDTPYKDDNPFITIIENRCILCGRCIRICEEVMGRSALAFINRGSKTFIGPAFGNSLTETSCEFCGQCVSTCPVGAIVDKPSIEAYRPWEAQAVTTTCSYCSVGCTMDMTVRPTTNEVVKVHENKDGVVNDGSLCIRGRYGYDFIEHKERLTKPMIHIGHYDWEGTKETHAVGLKQPIMPAGNDFIEAGWDKTYSKVVSKLKEISTKHGSDSIGFIVSTKLTNEEIYLAQKLAREGFHTNNIDNSGRNFGAAALSALEANLGYPGATMPLTDVPQSDVVLVVDSNITDTHPIAGIKVRNAITKHKKVYIVNSQRIDMVPEAAGWLAPAPHTTVALLNGLANVIIANGLENKDFVASRTEGFDAIKKAVAEFTPAHVAKLTGVDEAKLTEVASAYAKAGSGSILFGLNTENGSVELVNAITNLALLTGKIGGNNSGIIPVFGNANNQGALDLGAAPDRLPGHIKVTKAGLNANEMYAAAKAGKLKALVILGDNPAYTEADTTLVKDALDKLDFVVVSDMFLTETMRFADVVLPLASFAETDGTYTNLERRVQRVKKALDAASGKAGWEVLADLLNATGVSAKYSSVSDIIKEYAGKADLLKNISWSKVNDKGVMVGGDYLHTSGKLTFKEAKAQTVAAPKEYPFLMVSGRKHEKYVSPFVTTKTNYELEWKKSAFIELHPEDAKKAGITNGDKVKVSSSKGNYTVEAVVTKKSNPGVVFVTYHPFNAILDIDTTATIGDALSTLKDYSAAYVNIAKA